MADQTRRELLEAAWDDTEKDDEDVAVVDDSVGRSSGDSSGSVEDFSEGSVATDDGVGLDGGKADSSPAKTKKIEKESKKQAPDKTQAAEEAAAPGLEEEKALGLGSTQDRAPQSWKPIAREHWAKIPPEARAEIRRVDLEVQRTLSQTANVRKFANDFAQVINPFAHLIQSQHSTPLAAVKNLMTTAAGLLQGNSRQKAAIVAEICQNYKVDLQELDGYLAENWDTKSNSLRNGGGQRMEAPPQWAQPLFAMQQQIQENMEAHNQRIQEEAQGKIEEAETLPFFDDLRDDVADIMEIAAKHGRVMSIQQAYQKAAQLNPEVSKIIERRNKAAALAKGNGSISRARRAASSISGGPSGKAAGNKGSGDKPLSRREQLREAWDDAE